MEDITSRIEALREARGLSESELARSSAIPLTTFRRRLVAPETFTLAEFLRVAVVLDANPGPLWFGDAA